MTPYILGITGGIGSGKSCVGRLLASYCLVPLVDVDHCCRQLLEIDQPGWRALRALFGRTFFQPSGEVDRVTLRQRIFEDAEVRHQVDTLLHPLAREAMRTQVELVQAPLVLVEIPLLYEAGWRAEVDAVLVVYARRGVRCCRIMRRDRVSRRDATRAIVAQMSLEEKAARAEYLLENSREWAVTRTRVVSLGNTLSERFQSFFCPESS